MRVVALLGLALMTLPVLANAQSDKGPTAPPPPPDSPTDTSTPHAKERVGDGQLVIGEMAPDFELDGSTGAPIKISTLRGGWVLMVFGPRKENLLPLRSIVDGARTMGVSLVGVCDEKAYHLESYAKKEHITFPMLADVTDEIAQMYGLYDAPLRTTASGFVLIDKKGVVRMALLGQAVPPADILRLVEFSVTGQ